jgi:hypothetical protein
VNLAGLVVATESGLRKLLDLLREKGVEHFTYRSGEESIVFSFGCSVPASAATPPPPVTTREVNVAGVPLVEVTSDAPDTQPLDTACPCGHMVEIEHNSAGCLHGCDARMCEARPQPSPGV